MKATGKAVVMLGAIGAVGVGAANAGIFDPSWADGPNTVHACFEWVGQGVGEWDTTLFEFDQNSVWPLDPVQPPFASDDGVNVEVGLPNFIDPLPIKYVRIQFFFDGQVPGDLIDVQMAADDPAGIDMIVETDRTAGLGNAHYIDFEIKPNPDRERFVVFGNTSANILPGNLLKIEVHTQSIPAPSAAALAGLGGLVCLRRRRA